MPPPKTKLVQTELMENEVMKSVLFRIIGRDTRITVPHEFRKVLKIDVGDWVQISLAGNKAICKPVVMSATKKIVPKALRKVFFRQICVDGRVNIPKKLRIIIGVSSGSWMKVSMQNGAVIFEKCNDDDM